MKYTKREINEYIDKDLGIISSDLEYIVDFWTKNNTRIYAEFAGNENAIRLEFWRADEGEQAILIKSKELGKWQNISQKQINQEIDDFIGKNIDLFKN